MAEASTSNASTSAQGLSVPTTRPGQISASNSAHSSEAEVWYLKDIHFNDKHAKIITQNFNGPCSFIAICNILILRGNITIEPAGRTTVSYEFLSQLVAEYLLLNCPDVDVSAALSIMPHTQVGMDLNPQFTGPKSFRPMGAGGELQLFEQVGIELLHGWLVDPDSEEAKVVENWSDYDSAVTLIADADHTAKGQLVVEESEIPQASGSGSSSASPWTQEERKKIEDAMAIRKFLDNSGSQLTYHGLFTLAQMLPPGSLAALYRNLHLSVIYKSLRKDDPSLYTLVTDQVFLNEPSVVWERIEDVDGNWSSFVDCDFNKSSPAGGDFAGHSAAEVSRGLEAHEDSSDRAFAERLQAEEDARAARRREEYIRQEEHQRRLQELKEAERIERERVKSSKKKDCVIM